MTDRVKHGGCAGCGSKEQEILTSVMVPGEVMSKAFCDKCLAEKRTKQISGAKKHD